MADNIKVLVDKEMEAIRQKSKLPITMLVRIDKKMICRKTVVDSNRKTINAQVCLLVSVPVIVYLSSQASQSMRQSSRIFDEQVFFGQHRLTHTHSQVEDLNYEKRKTDGLLQQLLPVDIIAQLKAGEQPPPKYNLNLGHLILSGNF